MDIERIIAETELLECIFMLPDIRPAQIPDRKPATHTPDDCKLGGMYTNSAWFQQWWSNRA
jgi:hypothetical protein